MEFNFAQTFTFDPNAVANSSIVFLTSLDLFFKAQPTAVNNQSGITNPGVNIQIAKTLSDGTPDLNNIFVGSNARLEYSEIAVSNNASSVSTFHFDQPLPCSTGQTYAVLVKYDDTGYDVWSSQQGDRLVGTNTPFSGPVGKYVGLYYSHSNGGTWNADTSKDLMFRVNVAKFTANSATFELVNKNFEFMTINNLANGFFIGGEIVHEKNHHFSNGTISVTANTTHIDGTGTNFTGDLQVNGYMVIVSGNNHVVRKINSLNSANSVDVFENIPFTNAAAKYHVSPVAKVYTYNALTGALILSHSSANSSVRFKTNLAANLTINAGGTGYNNTDILTVSGGGATQNAILTLTTNSTGGITGFNFANNGEGFTSTPTYAFANSTAGASAGSGANVAIVIGSTIIGVSSNASANIASIDLLNAHQFNANLHVITTPNSTAKLYYDVAYMSGNTIAVDDSALAPIVIGTNGYFQTQNNYVQSRSAEVINANNIHEGKSSFIKIVLNTNEDAGAGFYDSPYIYNRKLDMQVNENVINNDANNENTRYGKALAKHITTKVNLAVGAEAEDLVVYAECWKPPGTSVLAYGKLYNSNDSDAFDDKDWTPLNINDGGNLTSSLSDKTDTIQITYGLPPYPPSLSTLAGTVTTTANSANVNGSNTSFALTAGQLVKIYSPLFPQNYMVSSVISNTNTTQFILADPVSNTGILGSGFLVDTLQYNHTAFNNGLNKNVARYYNSAMNAFDGFDTMALKFVLLSNTPNIAPELRSIAGIGVSA